MNKFRFQDYDTISVNFPTKGFSSDISELLLPVDYAMRLENLRLNPYGDGVIRYGLEYLRSTPENSRIRQIMSTVHGLALVSDIYNSVAFVQEGVREKNKIKFSGAITDLLKVEAILLIVYANGTLTEAKIKTINVLPGDIVEVIFYGEVISENTEDVLTEIRTPTTIINFLNFNSGEWILHNSSPVFSSGYKFRSCDYGEITFFTNGFDDIQIFDGSIWKKYYELINCEIRGDTVYQGSGTKTLIFEPFSPSSPTFFLEKELVLSFVDGTQETIKCLTSSYSSTTRKYTVTFQGGSKTNIVIKKIYLKVYLPKMNFIYNFNNRLLGLGEGPIGLNGRPNRAERMRVYVAADIGNSGGWYDESNNSSVSWFPKEYNKGIPSLELSLNRRNDNLEAIAQIGDNLLFFSREEIQVFGASQGSTNNFQPIQKKYSIPFGIVSGDCLIAADNVIYCLGHDKLYSLSILNETGIVEVIKTPGLDNYTQNALKKILSDPIVYNSIFSFRFDKENLIGFFLGLNEILVANKDNVLSGFSIFTGLFSRVIGAVEHKKNLYLVSCKSFFQYGTNNIYQDTDTVFLNGVNVLKDYPIPYLWESPAIFKKNFLWASKFFKVLAQFPSSFFEKNDVCSIRIIDDYGKIRSLDLSPKTIMGFLNYDNISEEGNFIINNLNNYIPIRLKLIGRNFSFSLSGETTGFLKIKKIDFFGVNLRG